MCNYDPSKVDESVGLFVCPYCKEYVVAGEEHPNFEEEDHALDDNYMTGFDYDE